MEFIQSRYQDVFSRFYEMVCQTVLYLVFAIIFSFLFSTDIEVYNYIVISLVFTALSVCYLLYVHRNGSKVIRLEEDKFFYKDNQTVTEFNWEDFQGYKISKTIPYQVILKDKIYGNTRFSYYAFSSKQRKKIFEVLQSKCS